MTTIISTTQTEHIAKKLTNYNVMFIDKNKEGKRHFPDGEVYVRLSKIDEIVGRVVVLHSGAPSPNQGFVELKMILEILKKSKASPVEVFFTYFPYGMQDKIKEKGETNMAENVIKELAEYYNVQKIHIIDAHFYGIEWAEKYQINNVSVSDLLNTAVSKDYPEAVFLAPDAGSQKRTGLLGVKKKRRDSYQVKIQSNEDFEKAVKNKTVAAVDDILETGGTLERFHDACIKHGAKDTVAVITHGALESGITRIKNKYSKLYLTNSINREEANVDISEIISNSIKD